MAKKSFHNTIYNCKEATLLLQKKEQRKITAAERVRLFFHLLFCHPCKLFVKQSKIINRCLHNMPSLLSEQPSHLLTDSAKARMQDLVDSSAQ